MKTTSRVSCLLSGLLLFAATVALFAPSVAFSLVNFDDHVFITHNPIVANGFAWRSVPAAFTSLHGDRLMYTPLLWLSYLADSLLFRASPIHPWGFHLSNVLLHAANAVLLYFILLAAVRRPWLAFFAAAFWSLHPLRVESVAWVTERKDTLSTFFAFLSILFYLKAFSPRGRGRSARDGNQEMGPSSSSFHFSLFTFRSRKGLQCLALVAFAAGLLSKPMLVTLPFLFLLLDVWPLHRVPSSLPAAFRTLLRLALRKWPFFLLSAVCAVATKILQTDATVQLPLLQRLYWLPSNYFFYLAKSFFPVALVPMCPGLSVRPLFSASVALFFLLLAAVAVRSFRRCPGFAVGLAAFTGLLFPVSGIVFIGNYPVADRYSYLPAIGLSLAIASLLEILHPTPVSPAKPESRIPNPKSRPTLFTFRFSLFTCLAIALLALSAVSRHILPTWENSDALYARIAAFLPEHYDVQNYRFSQAFFTRGDLPEAAEAADLVFASTPPHPRSLLNKILVISQTVSTGDALAFFGDHPLNNPKRMYLDSLQLVLAALEADAGDPDASTRHLALADAVEPLNTVSADSFHAAAAWILWRIGQPAEALARLRKVSTMANADVLSPEILLRPCTAVWELGLCRQALPSLLELARQAPSNSALLNNIAWLLATTPGSPAIPDDVLAIARQALASSPDHPVIQDTLAVALAFAGRFDDAIAVDTAVADFLRASTASDAPYVLANVEKRLALFREGRPYTEPASATLILCAR